MGKGQSRLGSIVETFLNVGSGFLLSLIVWQFLAGPMWGYEVTLIDNLELTTTFTIISVVRGYVWRRFFEGRITRS